MGERKLVLQKLKQYFAELMYFRYLCVCLMCTGSASKTKNSEESITIENLFKLDIPWSCL